MVRYVSRVLIALLFMGTSVMAYKYTVFVNPSVKKEGVNLTYTKKIVLGGWEPETFATTEGKKDFETGIVCLWGSEFTLDGGPYAGEKVEVRHGGNTCSGRTFTLGLKEDFTPDEQKQNFFVGDEGTLAVKMQ